ncbi:MAG: thiamine pyrophosphate-dependent enzyme [Candidatus Berkelbacteria bacterium]|nr:thiamine pyrophosphate-dependent enzyme [Candidatus Berkelbacteria bacterium]
MKIQKKVTLGIDIGCSLLSWNYFNFDTVQGHHGRSIPMMVGFKMARDKRIVLAMMGDGGGYAIGLQSLLHAAYRNNPISAILINNTDYSMTGGQAAPTTLAGEITTTTPDGRDVKTLGDPFHGPELVRQIAKSSAYIARASVSNPIMLEKILTRAIENQIKNNSFSFVEILSICPTNWKTNAKKSFDFLEKMEKVYPEGEIIKN